MKCTDFENRIELLFDDNTPAEVRREMLEHLETCPACAEFYRQTKAAFNAVAPRVEVQAPAGPRRCAPQPSSPSYCSSSIPSAAIGPTPQDVSSAMLPLNSTKAVRSASK